MPNLACEHEETATSAPCFSEDACRHTLGPECAICSFIGTPPPGSWYLENEFWRLGPFLAPAPPGVVLVYLRRHATGLSAMRPEELEALGPTLAAAVRAIEGVLEPERVYTVMFGEQIQHVHFVLMPRGSEVPVEHRSAALILNQAQYIDPEAALQATVRLREALRRQ